MSHPSSSRQSPRQLHFNLFLDGFGHHAASWRHPESDLKQSAYKRFLSAAQWAEKGKFDAVFFADSLALDPAVLQSGKIRGHELEPLTVLSAIAAQTTHIGLIATATTSYNEPYHIARKFASLDQISNGRAGWNLVTTDLASEAQNFSQAEHIVHQQRYARAEEFFNVVSGLWQSWQQDAIVADKARGQFIDLQHLHRLDYQGQYFQVRGPINVAPSQQGAPIVVQAGSSERGKQLAARTADVIFTAQPEFALAQQFYQDVKQRLPQFARQPQQLSILPGAYVVVANSRQAAAQIQQQLDALLDPEVGLSLLGRMLGNFDLSQLDLDAPLPELALTETGQQSRQQLLQYLGLQQHLSVRQLYHRVASGRGHLRLIGSATEIADQIEYWFLHGAADGFNIMPALINRGVADFVEQVIPILQHRGLFRQDYQSQTLRGHYAA